MRTRRKIAPLRIRISCWRDTAASLPGTGYCYEMQTSNVLREPGDERDSGRFFPRSKRNLCTSSARRLPERRVEGPGRVEGTISVPPAPRVPRLDARDDGVVLIAI